MCSIFIYLLSFSPFKWRKYMFCVEECKRKAIIFPLINVNKMLNSTKITIRIILKWKCKVFCLQMETSLHWSISISGNIFSFNSWDWIMSISWPTFYWRLPLHPFQHLIIKHIWILLTGDPKLWPISWASVTCETAGGTCLP